MGESAYSNALAPAAALTFRSGGPAARSRVGGVSIFERLGPGSRSHLSVRGARGAQQSWRSQHIRTPWPRQPLSFFGPGGPRRAAELEESAYSNALAPSAALTFRSGGPAARSRVGGVSIFERL